MKIINALLLTLSTIVTVFGEHNDNDNKLYNKYRPSSLTTLATQSDSFNLQFIADEVGTYLAL